VLTIPPLLIGAALLLWGWQTGFLVVASIMAVLLEASRLIAARWELEKKDYDRVWNLCAVLMTGVAIYCFAANDGVESVSEMMRPGWRRSAAVANSARAVLVLFQWWPVVFFPIMAAQAYGSWPKIDFTTFSWLFRRYLARQQIGAAEKTLPGLNISFAYFGICLFAASAQKTENPWFLPTLGLLVGWALFAQRARFYGVPAWGATMVVTLCLAFGAQRVFRDVHRAIERFDSFVMSRLTGGAVDAAGTRTALGAIGKLSLSGKIVIRLSSPDGRFPSHLREASYNAFMSPFWHATHRGFSELLPETNDTTWVLQPEAATAHWVRSSQFIRRDARLLAVPLGATELNELPVFRLETNRLGVLKVEEGPGFVDYITKYQEGQAFDSRPDEDDLAIPRAEEAALTQVALEAGVNPGMSSNEILRNTSRFFAENFQYSSFLGGPPPKGATPLEQFLLKGRSGHCEFFATATALLLRQAAIPTRYAVGYSVCEIKGRNAVVRERHAHAWCLAYVDGKWQDFDTTPASWSAIEADRAAWWEPLRDKWSQAWFAFSKWRYGKSSLRPYVPWLLGPLVAVLVAQLLWRSSKNRKRVAKAASDGAVWPGLDSEFYQIQQMLGQSGFQREPHESILNWRARIKDALPGDCLFAPNLVALHYRLRFDPTGLSAAERDELRRDVRAWRAKAARRSES